MEKNNPIASFTSSSLRCAQKYSTNYYEKNATVANKTMEHLFEQIGIFVTRTFQCEKYYKTVS